MLWCPCYWPESRIKIRVAVYAFATTGHECTLPSQYGLWFSTAKGAVVSQATVSPLTWWSLARKMPGKGADSIFRSSSNFRSLVANARANVRHNRAVTDSEGLRALQTSRLRMFVSQLRCRYLRYSKLFLPLSSLADTDTAPFNFSRTTAANPGLMLHTPSPLLLSNKRSP